MQRFLVQNPKDRVLAVNRRHDGDAEIDQASAIAHAEAAVLGNATLSDIQFRHHLDAGNKIGLELASQRRHGLLEHTVNAILHHHGIVSALNVNVARSSLQSGEDDRIHQPDHGADVVVLHQVLERQAFPGVFLLTNYIQAEFYRGIIQNALGGLCLLQEITHLGGRRHAHHQLPVQLRFQLIQAGQVGGVRYDDDQLMIVSLQRQELIVKHQLERDRAQQFAVRARITQVHKLELVTSRKLASRFKFLVVNHRLGQLNPPQNFGF